MEYSETVDLVSRIALCHFPFVQVQLQPVVHYFLINLNLVQKTQPHCHGTEFIISYFVHKPRDKTRILTLSSSVFIFWSVLIFHFDCSQTFVWFAVVIFQVSDEIGFQFSKFLYRVTARLHFLIIQIAINWTVYFDLVVLKRTKLSVSERNSASVFFLLLLLLFCFVLMVSFFSFFSQFVLFSFSALPFEFAITAERWPITSLMESLAFFPLFF